MKSDVRANAGKKEKERKEKKEREQSADENNAMGFLWPLSWAG